MQFKTTMKLNERVTIESTVEAKSIEEAVPHMSPLLDFTGKCGKCGKNNIRLNTRTSKDKQYIFTQYTCNDCGAVQQFGKLKSGGFFLKTWTEKFEGNNQENNETNYE
jgi:hypothetical protein